MRRALVPIQLLALAVGLSACGATDVADVDPVAAAATTTAAAKSSRVDFELRMDVGSERMTMSGEGVFAFDGEPRGRMTMEFPSFGPGLPAGSIELLALGERIYMRLPEGLLGGRSPLPAGKVWLGLDVEKAGRAAGRDPFDLSQLNGRQDPAELLRLLRASSASVEEDGEADVRGVRATRYVAQLDLEKATDASASDLGLDAREREALRAAVRELKAQTGIDEIPVEVFIDDAGLLRRVVMSMDMAVEGEDARMVLRYDFFDFGVSVDVEAPPAERVLDLTGEVAGAGG